MTRAWLRCLGIATAVVAGTASLRAAPPADVDVRAALDRTAVWVADRVTYTITIECHKGVDILADDLSKDKLHVDGLEILSSDSDRSAGPDDTTIYAFHYILTAYRVDQPELKIAPLTVRYYVKRAGQRIGDAAPAGEVQVPPAVVAFRSVLPDGQDTYAIRDSRNPPARRLRYTWLQPIGIGFVLISIVPVVVAAIAAARRMRPRQKAKSPRQVRQDERASFDALHAVDLSGPQGRREVYSQLNALVRDHLQAAAGIDAASLTPAEIDAALARHNGRMPAELVSAVLDACDRARYAPPDALPSADDCRQAIERAAHILGQA
jgi:hypothetical protein